MDIQAFLLAKYAEQTGDGLMTIVGGGIANLKFASFPHVFRNLAIVAKVLLEVSEALEAHEFKVHILGPDGKIIAEPPDAYQTPAVEMPPPVEYLYINLALTMMNVTLPVEGRYWVEMELDGKVVRKIPVLVQTVEEAAAQEAALEKLK
ncbi:MAG: DUF6941 family protein [Isosphaeraceae bacterium]